MSTIEVRVPDIGDLKDVPVIEIFVQPGDTVAVEDPLLALESDKASLEIPSPAAGTVRELRVQPGQKISEGGVILVLEVASAAGVAADPASDSVAVAEPPLAPAPAAAPAAAPVPPPAPVVAAPPTTAADQQAAAADAGFRTAHASPSVRRFARELGVDLGKVTGTGPRGRILQSDLQAFVKQTLATSAAAPTAASGGTDGGLNLLAWPEVDFAKFGPVEVRPLARIRRLSGANLARNWVLIPHVTQFDEADITELEAFRVQLNRENERAGIKLTLLAFLLKASAAALRRFPEFNASLDGDNLVLKQYCHIGFAADTPNGLVVPVLRDVDQKGVLQIGKETSELAAKARDGKLTLPDMQGGCFTISSLGGIGGTAFTPIINAPEVAILGVSRSAMKPVWNGKEFAPRLMLPLSLSYDHRVIDGAAAARFTSYLGQLLADLRRTLL